MSSEYRTLFIFSADTVNCEVLPQFLTGAFSSVYFTSKDKDFAARFCAELESCGVLQFVRSGRVAVTRQVKELNAYLREMDEANPNRPDRLEMFN